MYNNDFYMKKGEGNGPVACCLDALRKAGFEIPEIPYEPIYAADKKEAVEEIAAYNSENELQSAPATIVNGKIFINNK